MLIDAYGVVRGLGQRAFAQIYPRPGWVEHDPIEIWSTQIGSAAEALANAGVGNAELAAIGITNQRETTIVWDRRTGDPIYNAIVWQDRRTAEFCDKLRTDGFAEMIQRKSGLLPDAYFSASKIHWMLRHVPGAMERAERGELAFGTVDSWLIWKLTEGARHVCDATNASRTMLYDIHAQQWDDELLGIFGLPRSILPEVVPSIGVCGTATGALADVSIAGVAGDQQAALFGQMCTKPGMVKCTFGTGSFMLMNTGTAPMTSEHKLLTTIAWSSGGRTEYALEGSMLMAGAVVQWLRDELQIIRTAAEVEELAMSVPDAVGVVLVPAFSGLGAPHWDQYARGALLGMTRGTTRAHIARAALEGIALQVVDVLDAMQADSGLLIQELRVDGGAAANDMLMQLQADLLGVRVVRPLNAEATASGAAYLAGLGVGFWSSADAISAQWKAERTFEPQMTSADRDAMRSRWRKALTRAARWEDQ